MQELIRRIENYLTNVQSLPKMRLTDFIEILIIAFLLYHIMLWLKHTRAWALFKGLIVIGVFIVIAEIFHMSTILWIVRNVMGIAVIAIVIILQPELRKAPGGTGTEKHTGGVHHQQRALSYRRPLFRPYAE
jgi:diadenylate cyclase